MDRAIRLNESQSLLKKVIADVGDTAKFIYGNNSFVWNSVNKYAALNTDLTNLSFYAEGGESKVYINPYDGNNIYKAKVSGNCRFLSTSLCAIYAHNELFPNLYYEFLGFVYIDRVRVLLRQPFIKGGYAPGTNEVYSFLINNGYSYIGRGNTNKGIFQKGCYRVGDILDNKNNVRKVGRHIFFMDPQITFAPPDIKTIETYFDLETAWRSYVLDEKSRKI